MIEISYQNVQYALDAGFHTKLVCPTHLIADHVYSNLRKLYLVKDWSTASGSSRSIQYGITLPRPIFIQAVSITTIHESSIAGFDGIFMIHPELKEVVLTRNVLRFLDEMEAKNKRYLSHVRNEPRTA